MKRVSVFCCFLLMLALLPLPLTAQAKKLKVFISVDMEGIGGVVSRQQTGTQGFEYQRFRELMTAEVNAAIEAALEAGATEIVVADAHGNAQNILIDKLNPAARLVRSWPRPLMMMQGIDATFDAAIFIGYHGAEGTADAVLAHTMTGTMTIKLNGVVVPEAGFNAAIAGHFGVPVVMISGDQTIIAQARALLGNVEAAEVKQAYGVTSALIMAPERAQELIRERTRAALARLPEFKPYRLPSPITLELILKNMRDAELLAMLPWVERPQPNVIRVRLKDMVETAKFLSVVIFHNAQF